MVMDSDFYTKIILAVIVILGFFIGFPIFLLRGKRDTPSDTQGPDAPKTPD